MPRYYFDIIDGSREHDSEGFEFASLEDARSQAVRFAGELLRDDSHLICNGHGLRVQVLDEARAPLFTIVVSAFDDFPPP